MARRPVRKSSSKSARPASARKPAMADKTIADKGVADKTMTDKATGERDKIVAAFMALLAERPIEQIGLAEIAKQAGVSLTQLRGEFASTLAIYAAHLKTIDRAVLAQDLSDMADEPPRERLFDVLMRRLEAMAPYREAVRSLLRSAGRNPPLAFALNGLAVRSQQWMLTAAEIKASGPAGMMHAQGLAVLFSSVLRAWVRDEDPGLARTMAALDRALARGQRFSGILDDLCRLPARLCRLASRRSRRRGDSEESVAA
jgi:AcrR family transcriptional regulator